jgi:pectinesterase
MIVNYRRVLGLVLVLSVTCPIGTMAQDEHSAEHKVHIVLVGDSTVTDQSGWGVGFSSCVADGVQCTNMARGGRSSSSYRNEGLWDEALALKPDWVLIQFGHNDEPGHPEKENEPDKGYRANMERYVADARAAGIRPVLVTPISRRQWGKSDGDRDRIVSSLERYAEVVREIAAEKDVPLIDLHSRSKEVYQSLGRKGCELISPVKDNGQWDGTHMNQAGAVMFGSMVAMDCRSYVPGLAGYFPTSKLAKLQQNHPAPSMSERVKQNPKLPTGELTSKGGTTLTVARDGSGDFRTIQEAIRAAQSNNRDRTVIHIQRGVYMGQILIPASKPNISFVGEDRDGSIISYALTIHDPVPPEVPEEFRGYAAVVLADGFRAANLTFRQVAGDHGQAIALRIDGDRAILRDCNLVGWQDTVRLEKGRHYLRHCYIEGRVDYIYGGATAYFEDCTMHTKHAGYVTAASTSRSAPWGYVFANCKITGTDAEEVFLGRPWRPYASVTYLNCEMDKSIKPVGWHNWSRERNERTARYAEYHSKGPGAHPDERAEWSHQLTDDEAKEITVQSVLAGEDGWDPVHECAELTALY